MIRVVVFLIAVGFAALLAAWFADRPGGVEIVWLGYRISTSVAVLAGSVALLIAVVMFVWSLLRSLLRAPGQVTQSWRARRVVKGERAVVRGLVAVGAGDPRAARRHADEARRIAPDQPLTLLLSAQTAELAGDRAGAEEIYRAMAERDDLKALGLHGLFLEARRRNDIPAARGIAEEAARSTPSLHWAGQAVLEFRCAEGDWRGALEALDRNMANGLIDKTSYRRQRAVLLTAQAEAGADGDRDRAYALAVEAAKLAPDLVPAAALAGRFHAEAGSPRKAARVLDAAWKLSPHPDIAEAYINLRPGDSARERLARAQKLEAQQAGHIEGALALARAAIDAKSFAVARGALEPFLAAPTQRVALLMAELEEAESSDVGRARAWMARAVHAARDPAWTSDGLVSERWMPVSPASGRLDAFEWKVPLEALSGPVIDEATVDPEETEHAILEPPRPAMESPPARAEPAEASPSPAPRPKAPSPRTPDTVIPLVHAPDDPGPEPEEAPPPTAGANGRSRWRDLFG